MELILFKYGLFKLSSFVGYLASNIFEIVDLCVESLVGSSLFIFNLIQIFLWLNNILLLQKSPSGAQWFTKLHAALWILIRLYE